MQWNTLYIVGEKDFLEDVNKKLSGSSLDFLTGYSEHLPDGKFQVLYWLDSRITMPEFKQAIGAKLIWKYRLRFLKELQLENVA